MDKSFLSLPNKKEPPASLRAHTNGRKRFFFEKKKQKTFIILVCGVLVFPLWWMLVTAVADPADIRHYPPVFFPTSPSFAAFRAVLLHRPMLRWIGNSALVAGGSTALTMLLGVFGGYALSRFSSAPARVAGMGILIAKMIPTTLLVIPLYVVFRELGLIGTLSSAALAHCTVTIPFAIWMLKAYFDSIPRELEDAAMIDGCSPLGTLWRVVLPVSLPGLGATALYGFILSWNEFAFSRTLLIGRPENWTVTIGIASIRGEYIVSWNEIMAAAAIAALPIVLVFLWLERYLVAGLTAGAQK
jgi:multiple sugar transport system permease protein